MKAPFNPTGRPSQRDHAVLRARETTSKKVPSIDDEPVVSSD